LAACFVRRARSKESFMNVRTERNERVRTVIID